MWVNSIRNSHPQADEDPPLFHVVHVGVFPDGCYVRAQWASCICYQQLSDHNWHTRFSLETGELTTQPQKAVLSWLISWFLSSHTKKKQKCLFTYSLVKVKKTLQTFSKRRHLQIFNTMEQLLLSFLDGYILSLGKSEALLNTFFVWLFVSSNTD